MEVNGEEEIKGCIHLSLSPSPAGSPRKGAAATRKAAIAKGVTTTKTAAAATKMTAETAAAAIAVATITGQQTREIPSCTAH